MHIKSFGVTLICYLAMVSNLHADLTANTTNSKFKYPFYLGVTGGYGKTTWEGLIPPAGKMNLAMSMSTPKEVSEGGELWGLFAGYELLPSFALEAAYMHYPNAKISFDELSIFSFEHDGLTQFTSKTETVSLMAKIMMIIPCTDIRAYSSLGVAEVHRSDEISNHWIGSPTFGGGFNYNFTDHIMGELGGVYAAGKGTSELNPADDYFPFIYSVFFRLAYRL